MEDKVYLRLEATCRGEFPGLYKKLNLLRPFGNSKAPELSPREKQVWQLLTRHLSNKEIGSRLNISEKTVKIHRGQAMRKLDVDSVAELVRLAETSCRRVIVEPSVLVDQQVILSQAGQVVFSKNWESTAV